MKILIVEDDWISRKFLYKFLNSYGECDIVVDGIEALDAFMIALQEDEHYDLICLDIMIPKVDGVKVLKAIREMEKQKGIESDKCAKIIMTTALVETDFMTSAFEIGCDGYAEKPIDTSKLLELIRSLGLIEE